MRLAQRFRIVAHLSIGGTLTLGLAAALVMVASANVALTKISEDTYTNTTSQHKTQVEPDTFAFGSTIVAATQTGRFFSGGASNIAVATSTDNGSTWSTVNLPGITVFEGGPYDRVSDPSVAYDPLHAVWLVSSLAITDASGSTKGAAVVVSRSTDGGLTWGPPVTVKQASGSEDLDKNWTVCDTSAASPFYGRCYTEFDDFGDNDRVKMSTSTDGGLTWGAPLNTADSATGLGGQPVVQPSGTVIVPFANASETAIRAFRSTDGGATWSSAVTIASVADHRVAGDLRTGPLPSAEIDAAGKVYVVWQDCRFRRGCKSNDVVMSTSTDGVAWTPVTRIPIDSADSTVDHFIPGIAVDRSTAGGSAHVGLTYYFYPKAQCGPNNCQLAVGYVSSIDGGASWSQAIQLAGPMSLKWLPDTSQGRMVGDYISTSFNGSGRAYGAFAVASAPTAGGSDCAKASPSCNQPTFTPTGGLVAQGPSVAVTAADRQPLPDAASDHRAPQAASRRR